MTAYYYYLMPLGASDPRRAVHSRTGARRFADKADAIQSMRALNRAERRNRQPERYYLLKQP